MPSLPRGLYEELITEALEARLQQVGAQLHTARSLPLVRQAKAWPRRRPLHEAEAADRMAQGQASPA
jgi:hypothetical protein